MDLADAARDGMEDALPGERRLRAGYDERLLGILYYAYQALERTTRFLVGLGLPPVSAGWAPYTTGSWAFVEPWGWTWVDEAPWGFAPFHYGRWIMVRGAWAWVPGARGYRPVYAPA